MHRKGFLAHLRINTKGLNGKNEICDHYRSQKTTVQIIADTDSDTDNLF